MTGARLSCGIAIERSSRDPEPKGIGAVRLHLLASAGPQGSDNTVHESLFAHRLPPISDRRRLRSSYSSSHAFQASGGICV
jgi:hypothetical protein